MSIILAGYDWIPDPVFGANSCQAGGEVYLHFLQNNFNFYVKRFGSETRYPGHSVDKIQLVNRRDSPDAVWNIYSSKTKSDYTFPPKQAFLWFSNTQQPKFQRDFNVLMPVTSFEALFKERGGGSHTAHKDNKHARGICINVAALPLAIFRQTIILVWLSTYDRVLQSITEYYKVLQSITKTNLAHLLGPIFGLVHIPLTSIILHRKISTEKIFQVVIFKDESLVTIFSAVFSVSQIWWERIENFLKKGKCLRWPQEWCH